MKIRTRGWFQDRGFYYPPFFLGEPLLEEVVWRDGWLRKGIAGAAIRGQVVLVHLGSLDTHSWFRQVSRVDAEWRQKMEQK